MRYLIFLLLAGCNSTTINSGGGDVVLDNDAKIGHEGRVHMPAVEAIADVIDPSVDINIKEVKE